MPLPVLKKRLSPNVGSRHGQRVRLLVLHDMEGGYDASINWFLMKQSQVSAHYCLNADGSECTQVVELTDSAWAVCNYNSISVSLEMAGYEKTGYAPGLLEAAAEVFAWLAHQLSIPIQYARGGVGYGICSHYDLGKAGGGHSDPSTEPAFMPKFIAMVQAAAQRHDFPDAWEINDLKPCPLAPPNLDTISGVQVILNSFGAKLDVDGDMGPLTKAAIESFQKSRGLPETGVVDAATKEKLALALTGQGAQTIEPAKAA